MLNRVKIHRMEGDTEAIVAILRDESKDELVLNGEKVPRLQYRVPDTLVRLSIVF